MQNFEKGGGWHLGHNAKGTLVQGGECVPIRQEVRGIVSKVRLAGLDLEFVHPRLVLRLLYFNSGGPLGFSYGPLTEPRR